MIGKSEKWVKVAWDADKSEKFFYRLVIKQGESVVFDKRVDNGTLKVDDLMEGKMYKATLFVCTEKSNCKSNSKVMELQTIVSSGEDQIVTFESTHCSNS